MAFFEVCQLELGTTLFPKTLQYFNCFYEVIAKLLWLHWPLTCKFSLYLFGPTWAASLPPVVLGWWNLWKKEELILWHYGLFAKIRTWTWNLSRLGQYVWGCVSKKTHRTSGIHFVTSWRLQSRKVGTWTSLAFPRTFVRSTWLLTWRC